LCQDFQSEMNDEYLYGDGGQFWVDYIEEWRIEKESYRKVLSENA